MGVASSRIWRQVRSKADSSGQMGVATARSLVGSFAVRNVSDSLAVLPAGRGGDSPFGVMSIVLCDKASFQIRSRISRGKRSRMLQLEVAMV